MKQNGQDVFKENPEYPAGFILFILRKMYALFRDKREEIVFL